MGNCLNAPKNVDGSCYDGGHDSPAKSAAKYGARAGKSSRRSSKTSVNSPKREVGGPSAGRKEQINSRTRGECTLSKETLESGANSIGDECVRKPRRYDHSPCQSCRVEKCSHGNHADAHNQQYFIALFDYEPRTTHDLPLCKGSMVRVIEQVGPGWCLAELVRERYNSHSCEHLQSLGSGYVPFNYLAPYGTLECEDWYAGKCRRTDAERRLATGPLGAFLIRESETRPAEYALSVRDATGVKHYRVRRCVVDNQGDEHEYAYFVTRRVRFPTVQQLVAHYQRDSDGLSVRLLGAAANSHCTTMSTASRSLCGDYISESETYSERRIVVPLGPAYEREAPPIDGLSYDTCDSWEIPKSSVELRRKIGAGQFGEVYEAMWNGRTPVAVKTLKLTSLAANHDAQSLKRDFLAEAQILKRLRHPKLIQLYAVCTQDEPFFIVTELMRHGSLLEYLKGDAGNELTLLDMVNIGAQIASGMAYLEQRQFVHRDLAARNILVGENLQVKIADFGLARLVTHVESGDSLVYSPKEDAKFPIKWTAPEAAMCRRFSTKSDVWSFGVLLYELVSRGRVPYAGMTNAQVLSEITERGYRMPAPPGCPAKFYSLMLDCWHNEPRCRPTFETLQWQLEEYFLDDSADVAYDFSV